MNPLEAELRAWGVTLTPEQWARYREWATANPRGGRAAQEIKPRNLRTSDFKRLKPQDGIDGRQKP